GLYSKHRGAGPLEHGSCEWLGILREEMVGRAGPRQRLAARGGGRHPRGPRRGRRGRGPPSCRADSAFMIGLCSPCTTSAGTPICARNGQGSTGGGGKTRAARGGGSRPAGRPP